jgi:glycosyltransferase involved in cell wall biosynthesis
MAQPDPSNARPAAAGPETPARPADPSRAVAFVSTHCSIRNWAERRLYEPLAGRFRLEAIFWDRGRTMSPLVMQEAERFRIGVHEYRNERWGLLPLFDFYRHVVRSLDGIPASQLGWVVAADTDVLIPVLWHRLVRGRRYRVIREEVDYYAGSRNRGRGAGDAFRRLVFDALEALLHTQCDTVITLNRHAGARLRAWGVPESRLRIGGLWMKDEYMSDDREAAKAVLRDASVLTAEQYERVRGRRVISFYGLFYQHTHLRELFEAVARFPDDFVVVCVGRGFDQPVVEEYARRTPNVLYLGWRDLDEIKRLYTMTDIVYQPLDAAENINWKYFGSTNKTFESLAAGCMLIGSAINERIDLQAQARHSFQIDFGRDVTQQLVEEFGRLKAEPGRLREYQRNARTLFERYNHDAFTRVWLPLFDEPKP